MVLGSGEMNGQNTEDGQSSESTLYDIILLYFCPNTKTEP